MDASSRRVGRGSSAMPRIYPGYGDESSSIAPSSAHLTTITTGTSLPSSQPPSSVGIAKKSQAMPIAPPPSSESISSSRTPFISAPTHSRAPTSDISASSFSSGPVPASSIPTAYTAPQYPTLRSPTTSASSSSSSSVPIAAPQPIIASTPVPVLTAAASPPAAAAAAPPPAVVRVPPSILVNSNSHSMPNPSPYSQIVPRSSVGRREPPGRSGMPSRVPTTDARESRATRRERERDVGQPSSPVLTRSRRAGDASNPTVTSTTTATRSRRTGAAAPTSPRTPGPAGYRTIAPSSTNTRTRTRTRTGTTAVTSSSARRRKLRKEALDRRLLQTTIALVFVAIVVVMMFDRSAFRGWLWGEEDALGGLGGGRSRSSIFGGRAEPRVDVDDDLFAWPGLGSVSQSARSHADTTGGQGRETTTQTRVEHDDNSEGDERPLSMPRTPAPVAPPPSHPHPPHESAEELSTAVGPRVPNSSSVSFFDPQRVWEYMQASSPPPSSPPPPPFYDSNSGYEEQASSRAMRVPRVREIMGPDRVDDRGARRVERLHGGKRELREMYGLGYEAGAPYGNEYEEAQAVGLWQRIGGGQ